MTFIPFLPWVEIPAATITFCGQAWLLEPEEVSADIIQAFSRGMYSTAETSPPYAIIEITPEKDFATYGVGIPLMGMRDTQNVPGRVPVT